MIIMEEFPILELRCVEQLVRSGTTDERRP